MKYVLAKLNVYGEPEGFWVEEYNKDTGTMHGKVVEGIQECDAKIYYNYEDAFSNCKTISNNCDILLKVISYKDETSIYSNNADWYDLRRIVSKYAVEDLASVIHKALMLNESVKLANELNYLNSGSNRPE